MKKKMNQAAALVLLSTLGFGAASAVPTQSAHALVSAAFGGPIGLTIGGLVTAMAGTFVAPFSAYYITNAQGKPNCQTGETCDIVSTTLGYVMIGGGLILMDAQSGSASFAHLSETQAHRLELSPDETRAFNENLDELNAVADTVAFQLAQSKKADLNASRKLWDQYGASLEPQALAAARKLVTNAMKAGLEKSAR